MQFNVHSPNMQVSDALKDHVEDKMLNALKKLVDDPSAKLDVRLSNLPHAKDGKHHEVHAAFTAPHNQHFDVTEVDEDMYKAVDVAHHRLVEAVRRQLAKRRNNH